MATGPSESERLSLEEASTDPRLFEVIEWIRHFLCAPNPNLGRTGDVCPFARTMMSRQSVDFFRNFSNDVEGLTQDIRRHLEDFQQHGGHTDIYRSRIIVPTGVEDAARAVEHVQRELKPSFVERHLMLGQFFPDCSEPGLWSRSFRPLQAPIPLLAIRNLVPTDIAFLYDDDFYVRVYLEKFGRRGEIALQHFETTREAAK